MNTHLAPHVLIYIRFRYTSAWGFSKPGGSWQLSYPYSFSFVKKICGNQILQAPCVHFQKALNVQLITILHFWSLGRWLWLKKQKAHCFNTALMINLCTLVHWTKKDKSQTDALICLCGFICKDTAIHKQNHLKMHWVLWKKKDSKYRDY